MTLTEKELMTFREKLARDSGRKGSAGEARAPLRGSKLLDRYWEPTGTLSTGETLWASHPRSVAVSV